MDSLDSVSNCSESSIHSELLPSYASSLSCLSSYQGEFLDLKHLIDTKKNCTVSEDSEERIKYLTLQLRNSLKQNEKHKTDLYDLQKTIELSFYEKIEILLKRNNQLENSLKVANKRIERLVENCSKNNTNETTGIVQLKNQIIELEKSSHDLNLKNSLLQNELIHIKNEKTSVDTENKGFKYEVNNLKLELNAKLNCIKELKNKVSEQHIQAQNTFQINAELKQSNSLLINELEFIKKTEIWYKEQLQLSQNQKRALSDELNKIKQNFFNQQAKLEQVTVQFNKSKAKCEELELNFLKERELMLKKLGNEHFQNTTDTSHSESHFTKLTDFEIKSNYYDATIRDLTDEVIRVKKYITEQQHSFTQISKDNSELLAKCVLLQNKLEEKEYLIENLNRKNNDLSVVLENQNKSESELFQLKNNCSNLQIELRAEKEEKQIIENSVKIIKNQLRTLKDNYNRLKENLTKKNKEIIHLQSEKQELFMNNNWKICELEKNRGKERLISELKDKINILEQEKKCNAEICKSQLDAKLSEYICQFYSIESKDFSVTRNEVEYAQVLLKKIDTFYKRKYDNKNNIINGFQKKIHNLVEKCAELENKSEELLKTLSIATRKINSTEETDKLEKIKYWKALLRVKELEMEEKEKKYETNYRTLLRKVKEHMKGRQFAEKYNKELQQVCKNTRQEQESLKLILSSKESEIVDLKTILENVKDKLEQSENLQICLCRKMESKDETIDGLKRDVNAKINELNAQNKFLINELELVNSNLQQKSDELTEFQSRNCMQKEKDAENVIMTLKNEMHPLQNEVNQLRNDNFFLKRICNDLRTTVNSHSSHNKFLQEKLNFQLEKEEFLSLPVIQRPHKKCDEDYINKLLEENKIPQKSSFNDIQDCLNVLKNEIMNLQKQVVDKNL